MRCQHKDGHTIPVEIISHKMKLDKRNVIYSIFRDITTRKKTESELLEKTVMLETVSGSVPAYIFMKDKDLITHSSTAMHSSNTTSFRPNR
ncbi:PAS domain S-box protein [Prosthecochloris sp. SCSIO W1101]|uniref:PAS domain S-box protein n=1 Tax=Prosthecochloris sp. SCSIO W1101 TaxID=2992242 RepID=UPI0039FCB5FD